MRANRTSIVAALLTAGVVLAVFAQSQERELWHPGQFGELVAGKSTRRDVLRFMGKIESKRTGHLEIYSYQGKGDFGGDVIIEIDRGTGRVESITEQFATNITRTQAYKKFGRDYKEVHYSIADCTHDGVNPMAYRDAKGPVEMIEYPGKGLLLWPNREGFDFAAAVFLAKPLPAKKPSCAKR